MKIPYFTGVIGILELTNLKMKKLSKNARLQFVFDTKIGTIITIKKNERMNQMKITYREVNGYLIPNLKLPPEEANVRLGKWGMMYKSHLEKHRSALFNSLLIKGKLYQHCAEVERQANEMYDILIEQMKESEIVTEELKEQNQLEWVQKMGNIQQRAKEIVSDNLIYT